jgi:hypothetical protein
VLSTTVLCVCAVHNRCLLLTGKLIGKKKGGKKGGKKEGGKKASGDKKAKGDGKKGGKKGGKKAKDPTVSGRDHLLLKEAYHMRQAGCFLGPGKPAATVTAARKRNMSLIGLAIMISPTNLAARDGAFALPVAGWTSLT